MFRGKESLSAVSMSRTVLRREEKGSGSLSLSTILAGWGGKREYEKTEKGDPASPKILSLAIGKRKRKIMGSNRIRRSRGRKVAT